MNEYNPLPNIETGYMGCNPCIGSPSCPYVIGFYQTRESLMDTDVYRAFLKNIEKRVRQSVTYHGYKGYLMENGMDHCQIHGNINSDMADLEMHHAMLTLFDIALMVSEWYLNKTGFVSSFDVVQTIKDEHRLNELPIVMLSKTPHQVYHNNTGVFVLHPDMFISKKWPLFFQKYKEGITQDLAFKLIYYIKRAQEAGHTDDQGLLDLRETIKDWSGIAS